ncbi:radical SAM protein [Methanobrevibacter arboriphilus]|uniref:radical SAM protein n=1 Tax=Methanobrevibacter arboriphilus TaxID=39441 RepID=UPI0006D00EA6|nr:radical SAM protein [Methanobrevibacter arboriphilus]
MKAIKNFVDLGIFVEVSTTVTEHNIKEIPDMINFLKELKVDWFMLYNFIPTGNGSEISSLDISPEKREKLLMKAYQENTDKMQILSTAPQYAAVAESINSKRNRLNGNFTSFEVNSNKNNYKNIYENNNKNNYEYTNENNYENNDENNSENRYEDNNEYLNFKNEIYDEANNEKKCYTNSFL